MKTNEAPEKIYLDEDESWHLTNPNGDSVEYIRTNVFIERVTNFLSYKLDDIVSTRVPGTIIPHHIAKQEFIDDLKKYMKGE